MVNCIESFWKIRKYSRRKVKIFSYWRVHIILDGLEVSYIKVFLRKNLDCAVIPENKGILHFFPPIISDWLGVSNEVNFPLWTQGIRLCYTGTKYPYIHNWSFCLHVITDW